MPIEATEFSAPEQARIVATAQDLFLERGISAVSLADVALTGRVPAAAMERYFPGGKAALVSAVADHYGDALRQRLDQNVAQSSNAVEEMLRLRRTLTDSAEETRRLFLQELANSYPVLYQHLEAARQASVLAYMRRNLLRGQQQDLYLPTLDVEQQAQRWLRQATETLQTVADPRALAETMAAHTTDFLGRVTTPAGAYAVRRLQEAAPYY